MSFPKYGRDPDAVEISPDFVLNIVRGVGAIGLDPCTEDSNPTGARLFLTKKENGLTARWPALSEDEVVYVNPPYAKGIINQWVGKCAWEWVRMPRRPVLMLLRLDSGVPWFEVAWSFSRVACQFNRRLRFSGAKHVAPFSSVLFLMGTQDEERRFCAAAEGHGYLVDCGIKRLAA